MSLIAAVAASGYTPEHVKPVFVAEMGKVAMDTLFWVRREAAFALGALAKIVDEELLIYCLVSVLLSWLSNVDSMSDDCTA